ncbi:4-alpha-glucanotransferase [Oricola cellulosilytica]|uniref:4-alpha-glucanotransferase n=1 Tax=Oricola cellulosilytica TaxID=1429082 RepID=A0A4R0PIC0_9HYPH|nr:4-alpha-glucanotransferase [Oricola cellulosilytica]TCD16270.1 4-alpha-glucanotransferase [Oricola cellulosilytica]
MIDALAARAGLVWRFKDGAGCMCEAPVESRRAVLAALGFRAATDAEAGEQLVALDAEEARRRLAAWIVVRDGEPLRLPATGGDAGQWRLELESGEIREGRAEREVALDALPVGRHRLTLEDGHETTLLAVPDRLPTPDRAWGVTLPLYGLLPEHGGGIGTYRDLERAARALASRGASFVGVNPVHSGFPLDPLNFSPYAPSSRRHFNTSHIGITGEPVCSDKPLVDYETALVSKRAAQEKRFAGWREGGEKHDFKQWLHERGALMSRFSAHQVLSDAFGPYWPDWPAEYRDIASPAVSRFVAKHAEDVRFHAWLQWQAETQLSDAHRAACEAGMRHGLYLDLAVGTHPAGAETWMDPAMFARGVSLGAPPDAFSPDGQVWGVTPLSPRALVRDGFAVLAETLRRQLTFCGLLRVDHILGFERTFWSPDGLPGLYVNMPKKAMLAVVRIEAARAGASIVGEDLGNIPEGLRADLEASGILGCRVAMFEREWEDSAAFLPPDDYAEHALASFGSHDLPTWRGWRKGADIAWRHRLSGARSAFPETEMAQRQADVSAFDAVVGSSDGKAEAMHRFLARTSSVLAAAQIEDIFGLEEQANLPGTVLEHPNWRRRLPLKASEFADDDRLAVTAEIMKKAGR